jgi:predicted amidohydrolase YtcJ
MNIMGDTLLPRGSLARATALDPFAVAAAELKDLRVLLTVVGGRVVFDAASPRHDRN